MVTTIARRLQQENPLTLAGIVTRLMRYVDTNMDGDDIMQLAKLGMSMDMDGVSEFRIPADGAYQSGMYGSTWAIKPNFEKNKQLLYEFIYGN